MTYEFVNVKLQNSAPGAAYLKEHEKIINEYAAKGYQFVNWLPLKQGPSGKILEITLIFSK